MTTPREFYSYQDNEVKIFFQTAFAGNGTNENEWKNHYRHHTGADADTGEVTSPPENNGYIRGLVRRRFGFKFDEGISPDGTPYYNTDVNQPKLTRSDEHKKPLSRKREALDLVIMISQETDERSYTDLIDNFLKPKLISWNDKYGDRNHTAAKSGDPESRKRVQEYVGAWLRSEASTKEIHQACKTLIDEFGIEKYPIRAGTAKRFLTGNEFFTNWIFDGHAGLSIYPNNLFRDLVSGTDDTLGNVGNAGGGYTFQQTPTEAFGFAQKLADADFAGDALTGRFFDYDTNRTTDALAEALIQERSEENKQLFENLEKLTKSIDGIDTVPGIKDENDILNIRQCFLLKNNKFAIDGGGFAPEWINSQTSTSLDESKGTVPFVNTWFKNRIYRARESRFLFNKLLANPPKQGQWFADFKEKRKVMNKKLFWIYTDANGDLKQTELFLTKDKMAEHYWKADLEEDEDYDVFQENHGLTSANLNIRKGYYYLKSININYDGTNPSTARKDVVVEMEFSISSLASLELPISNKIAEIGDHIKLYDLVTLPVTDKISNSDNIGKMGISSYDPDYSRVRLVVYEDREDRSAMIIDLSTIDHEINRSSDTGDCTFKITYRGYFEQVLTMPFTDVLANKNKRDKRRQIDSALDEIRNSGKCSVEAIRESKQIEAQWYRENTAKVKSTRFITELWEKGLIYDYKLDTAAASKIFNGVETEQEPLVSFLKVDAGETPYFQTVVGSSGSVDINDKLYVENYGRSRGEYLEEERTWWAPAAELVGADSATTITVESGASVLPGSCFFLGDLFNVALEVLYDDEETKKKLQLEFIFGSIAEDSDGTFFENEVSNPLDYAVDVAVFLKWFEERVVAKKISFYPVTTFFRDMMQKLLVDIKMKFCLNNETEPPQYRMAFITTDETQPINVRDGYLDLDQPFINYNTDDPSRPILTRAPISTIKDTKNYCVFYQQSQSRFETTKYNDLIHTPRIFYGMKNNRWNFVSNVTFAKTDAPFLREARYFNNNFGDLSLLSNVYDLSFSFNSRMGNKVFYPGVIFEFILLDWGPEWSDSPPIKAVPLTFNEETNSFTAASYDVFGPANPHKLRTISNITGFGGYFIVKSVSYRLGETNQDYEIAINSKFIGANESVLMRNGKEIQNVEDKPKSISDQECLAELRNITGIKEKTEND
jgi:hypothetical protein